MVWAAYFFFLNQHNIVQGAERLLIISLITIPLVWEDYASIKRDFYWYWALRKCPLYLYKYFHICGVEPVQLSQHS